VGSPPTAEETFVETTLPVSESAVRLREATRRRPAIEHRRHWLTQRCLTGDVDGTSVILNVEARYIGRLYARNTWKTGFRGRLATRGRLTVLVGTFGNRFVEGTGQLWLLRPLGALLMALAIITGLEGIIGGRSDYALAFLLLLPGVALVVAAPGAVARVTQRVNDDRRLLQAFLVELLHDGPASPGQSSS
jgi:hypothetical protein